MITVELLALLGAGALFIYKIAHMDQLTKNFKLAEFACHNGEKVPPQFYGNVKLLAKNLQVLRDHYQRPVVILSGYRSPDYNASVEGAAGSKHQFAMAADIRIEGVLPEDVARTIESLIASGKMDQGGLGRYSTFTHYDVRGTAARWKG